MHPRLPHAPLGADVVHVVAKKDQDSWSYGGPISAGFDKQSLFSSEVREKVQASFMQNALVKVFSDELLEMFFKRGYPEHAPRSRERYISAITTMCQYMQIVGFDPKVIGEFGELGLALDELKSGIVRHYLKPSPSGSRPNDPGDIWDARAFVAMAVDHIMSSKNVSRRGASRFISEKYGSLSDLISPNSKGDFTKVIESWHREFEKGGRGRSKAQSMFDSREQITTHPRIVALGVLSEIMRLAEFSARRAAPPKVAETKSVRTSRPRVS